MKIGFLGLGNMGTPMALRLLASGRVRVDGLISEQFPLQRAAEAFDRAAEKGVLKVLLRAC